MSELPTRGFAVFPDFCSTDEVAVLRAGIDALVREARPPSFYAPETVPLGGGLAITATGLAIEDLFAHRPDFEPLVLKPALLSAMRGALGEAMRVELVGAVVSDASRPFFRWHTHIGAEDEGARYRSQSWPIVERIERVLALLYLDDLDDDLGPLLVLPRRVGEPTAPPGSIDDPDWPGRVEIRARAGTLVALEQCTWHAARQNRTGAQRVFIGAYFAA